MGDGGTIANLGQKQLNLTDNSVGSDVPSIFKIAAVTRSLMSVGKCCDEGHSMTFDDICAAVRSKDGQELCRFRREPFGGGVYVAKLKLKSAAGLVGRSRQSDHRSASHKTIPGSQPPSGEWSRG